MRTQKINSHSSGYVSSHELLMTREFQFFSVLFPRLTESNFVSEGQKRVDFVDSEMCLLLVMSMGCWKKRTCLCSPASLCNSRTPVVPIHCPSYLFPQFMTYLFLVIYKLPLCSETGHIPSFFSIFPLPSPGSPLFTHQAKMSHFPTARTSRLAIICDKGGQSKFPSQYFQQEQEQVPQGPLHRPADLPKAGRLKLGASFAC